MRGLIVAVLIAGCVESNVVHCDDGRTCPGGKVCDDVHGLCVDPDQLVTCSGLEDNAQCHLDADAASTLGECDQNVCLEQLCGDRAVTHLEACDGEIMPAVGTCVDYEFDYGPLGCSDLCAPGVDDCKQLGWRFRVYPGVGANRTIYEDSGVFWIANQNGIGRCDATSCTVDATIRKWHTGIWAGGGHVFATTQGGTITHFDGTSWSESAVINPPGTAFGDFGLHAVWGRSPTELYAVGRLGRIFRYSGATWSEMTNPAGQANLKTVWGNASTVFVAGEGGIVMRLDGGAWTTIALPSSLDPSTLNITGIWGASATDVHFVGTRLGIMSSGFLVHFDGASWTELAWPFPVNAISGRSASEVYAAVATSGDVLFFDGAGWTTMIKEHTSGIQSVFAGEGRVLAAGLSDLLLELENVGWTDTPGRAASANISWGADVKNVFAMSGATCQIFQSSFGGWTQTAYPTCMGGCATNFWLDMHGSAATNVYAGGPYGHILMRDANGWNCAALPASVLGAKPMWTWGVWANSASDVFGVGGAGDGSALYMVHFNGASWEDWSDRIRPVLDYAFAVWSSGASNVYVAGRKGDVGALAHFNGSTWSAVPIEVPIASYRAIWGSGPADVYAVGSDTAGNGAVLHFDGAQWSRVAIPEGISLWTTGPYEDVHGSGPNDVYVAASRVLLHFDGTSWYPIRRTDAETITEVQAIGGQVFVTSNAGAGIRLVGDLAK